MAETLAVGSRVLWYGFHLEVTEIEVLMETLDESLTEAEWAVIKSYRAGTRGNDLDVGMLDDVDGATEQEWNGKVKRRIGLMR